MNKTNSLLLAGVLSATLMTSVNVNAAETAAPAAAPASPHTLTANVGFFTDYIFRGISYARERGSIQGGFDYSNANGLYAGVWGSNVNPDPYAIQGNSMEIDLYGGYVHTINPDLSINVGVLQFYYPNNKKDPAVFAGSSNTTELNAAVTYKYFTLKHSYVASKFFGFRDSQGSGYTEFNVNYPVSQIAGLNLTAHVGRQFVAGTGQFDGIANLASTSNSVYDYTDWQIGFNKDFSVGASAGWNAGLSYIDTNAKASSWYYADGFLPGESKVLGFIKRTF
jgi:uncharacterized protein (TIGR02001 family)